MNQNIENNNKKSFWVSAVIILVAIGMIATYSSFLTGGSNGNSNTNNAPAVQTSQTQIIQYQGEDGVDAMTILQKKHNVDASAEGFVNSIDGVKPGEKQYWALYVNNQPSITGAKKTITKSTDSIEWKLDGF